jgi:hypothetical protein
MNKPRLRTALAAALLAVTVTGTSVATGTAASAAPAPAAPSAATAGAAPDAAPVAQNALGTLTSEVTGTFTDANGGAGTFTGTFTPSTFAAVGNQIQSTGVLTGNMVNSDGTSQPVLQSQTFAVTQLDPVGCQVLDLVLAPLDLDLLGLVVHLDRVHLNITAVPGAGNLLGNLLCAIVGLLDGAGTLAQIAALLNQILALLGL